MKIQLDLSSEKLSGVMSQARLVSTFWEDFNAAGDLGAATWEDLEKLEQEAKECLAEAAAKVVQATTATAKAMSLIATGAVI